MSYILPTVSLVNGIPMATSLDVAEKFGKKHQHVLEAIRKLIEELPEDFTASNFRPVEYTDSKGEKRPMYHLTRDAFSLLAMGFTGKKALAWKVKYIEAFNLMEARLLKQEESKEDRTRRLAKERMARYRERKRLALESSPDKYEAYLEAVEDFRADTARRIDVLLNQGLALLDTRRLGPDVIVGFTPILIDWLQRIAGQHAPLISPRESMNRAIDYSPLYIIRYMEKMAVSQ